MAVTHVTTSKNLDSSVDYTVKGKPHHANKYVHNRTELVTAVNGNANPEVFKKQNDLFLKKANQVHKGSIQCFRTIISFDPKYMDSQNSTTRDSNIKKANAIGRRVASRLYPHQASLIVTQDDNAHFIIHDHIITVSRRLDNYKSTSNLANFKDTRPYTDEALYHYGLHPLENTHKTPSEDRNIAVRKLEPTKIKYTDNNGKTKYKSASFIHQLRHDIVNAAKHSYSVDSFVNNLKKHNIQIVGSYKLKKDNGANPHHYYKANKFNQKDQKGNYPLMYHFHYYKKPPSKNDQYKLITPTFADHLISSTNVNNHKLAEHSHIQNHIGEYLRLQKHMTYYAKDNNGNYHIFRAKKLGSVTDVQNIANIIRPKFKAHDYKANYTHTKPFHLIQSTYFPKEHPNGVTYPGLVMDMPFSQNMPKLKAKKYLKDKTGFDEPEMVPKKAPMPKKPDISQDDALNQLIDEIKRDAKIAASQERYQAMMDDALRLYSRRKAKRAIILSEYAITKRAAIQENEDINNDIKQERAYTMQRQLGDNELAAKREIEEKLHNNGITFS